MSKTKVKVIKIHLKKLVSLMNSKFVLCTLVILTTHTPDLYAASEKEIQAELDRLYHSIDLEKIDKVIPKEREYTEEELKSFIDEDGDGAEDRLEVFFVKEKFPNYRRKRTLRFVLLKNYIIDTCVRKKDRSEPCKKLYATYFSLGEILSCKKDELSRSTVSSEAEHKHYLKLSDIHALVMKKIVPKSFDVYIPFRDLQNMIEEKKIFNITNLECR